MTPAHERGHELEVSALAKPMLATARDSVHAIATLHRVQVHTKQPCLYGGTHWPGSKSIEHREKSAGGHAAHPSVLARALCFDNGDYSRALAWKGLAPSLMPTQAQQSCTAEARAMPRAAATLQKQEDDLRRGNNGVA